MEELSITRLTTDKWEKALGSITLFWDTTPSHHIYEHPELEKILSIPVHRNQDLKVGTLRALMKIAQLTEEDLL